MTVHRYQTRRVVVEAVVFPEPTTVTTVYLSRIRELAEWCNGTTHLTGEVRYDCHLREIAVPNTATGWSMAAAGDVVVREPVTGQFRVMPRAEFEHEFEQVRGV